MCLDKITKVVVKDNGKTMTGYKVFCRYETQGHGHEYGFPFFGIDGMEGGYSVNYIRDNRRVEFGEWINALERTILLIRTTDGGNYIPGFHIFTKKKDAIRWGSSELPLNDWEVLKVKYRKIICVGVQNGRTIVTNYGLCTKVDYAKVVVAREMMVEGPCA